MSVMSSAAEMPVNRGIAVRTWAALAAWSDALTEALRMAEIARRQFPFGDM